MGIDEIELLRDLDASEKVTFTHLMTSQRKSTVAAYLLAIFFGWIGGHHYYFRNWPVAILYTLFSWTTIPLWLTVIELLLIYSYAQDFNKHLAYDVFNDIKRAAHEAEFNPGPGGHVARVCSPPAALPEGP